MKTHVPEETDESGSLNFKFLTLAEYPGPEEAGFKV